MPTLFSCQSNHMRVSTFITVIYHQRNGGIRSFSIMQSHIARIWHTWLQVQKLFSMDHTLNYYVIWLLFNISSLLSVH